MSTLAENMELGQVDEIATSGQEVSSGPYKGHDEELLLAMIYSQIERAEESCFRLRFYLDDLKV